MQRELFVSLQLEVPHHFIERLAGRWVSSVEDPGALGTAKTSKLSSLNPYQLTAHVGLISPLPSAV